MFDTIYLCLNFFDQYLQIRAGVADEVKFKGNILENLIKIHQVTLENKLYETFSNLINKQGKYRISRAFQYQSSMAFRRSSDASTRRKSSIKQVARRESGEKENQKEKETVNNDNIKIQSIKENKPKETKKVKENKEKKPNNSINSRNEMNDLNHLNESSEDSSIRGLDVISKLKNKMKKDFEAEKTNSIDNSISAEGDNYTIPKELKRTKESKSFIYVPEKRNNKDVKSFLGPRKSSPFIKSKK